MEGSYPYDKAEVEKTLRAMLERRKDEAGRDCYYTADLWTEKECVYMYYALQEAKEELTVSAQMALELIQNGALKSDGSGQKYHQYMVHTQVPEKPDATFTPYEAFEILAPQVLMYEYKPYTENGFVSMHDFLRTVVTEKAVKFYTTGSYEAYT